MLEMIKRYIRNLPYPMIVDRKEYEYSKAFFDKWKDIYAHLEEGQSPLEMGLYILKKTCEFYLAEWCGILKVDMDIGVWTPEIWYDSESGGMKDTLVNEFEFTENFSDWVNALENYTPIVLTDIEPLKDTFPMEYQAYCRLEVQSVIGVPIDRNRTGLLVVKNMTRFRNDADFLRMVCSLLMLIFGHELPKTNSLLQRAAPARDDDVRINVLGQIEIITASGVIREDTIRQNRTWKILIYLLSKERAVKAYEMVRDLWPDEPEEKCMINIRGAIYRFRQRTAGLTEEYLIISLPTGYSINPKYHISTDAEQMEEAATQAKKIQDTEARAGILKTAFPLYRGSVFESSESEPWNMMLKTRYSMLYVELVNTLLDALCRQGDERGIREYALMSLAIEPGNPTAYYHLISSIKRTGGSIQRNLEMAKTHLTDEEYFSLYQSLSIKADEKDSSVDL